MICVIDQIVGLGDIFCCQKIAKHYISKGYDVIWPVKDEILYVRDYISVPGLKFISFRWSKLNLRLRLIDKKFTPNEFPNKDIFVPLFYSHRKFPGCVMRSKFKLVNLDWSDWPDYFHFNRNMKREEKLYYDILGLKDGERFNLINRNYFTAPNTKVKKEVCSNNSLRDVEMQQLKGTHIFDWCKVLELAENIYTVDTVILFLIEMLPRNHNLFLWSRTGDYTSIDGLFKKPWKYMDADKTKI